jgi:hypothetical protein
MLELDFLNTDFSVDQLLDALRRIKLVQHCYRNAEGKVPPGGWPDVIDGLLRVEEEDPLVWLLRTQRRRIAIVAALDLLEACVPWVNSYSLGLVKKVKLHTVVPMPRCGFELHLEELQVGENGFRVGLAGSARGRDLPVPDSGVQALTLSCRYTGFTHAQDDSGYAYLVHQLDTQASGALLSALDQVTRLHFHVAQTFYPRLREGAQWIVLRAPAAMARVTVTYGSRRPLRVERAEMSSLDLGRIEVPIRIPASL